METTKEQRDTWASVAAFGDFRESWRDRADEVIAHLVCDVNTLEEKLGGLGLAVVHYEEMTGRIGFNDPESEEALIALLAEVAQARAALAPNEVDAPF